MCVFDWKVEVQHWTGNTSKKTKKQKNKTKNKKPYQRKKKKAFWLVDSK